MEAKDSKPEEKLIRPEINRYKKKYGG